MPEPNPAEKDSTPAVKHGLLRSTWGWLSAPLTALPTATSRRQRLLAWLLLFILLMMLVVLAVVLAVNPAGTVKRHVYVAMIVGFVLLMALGYVINGAGNYRLAAGLLVAIALMAPWTSVILDPTILRGDFVPLAYTVVAVLLSSILLTPFITGVLASAQLLGVALIAATYPDSAPFNWPSLLAYLAITSVLCILSGSIGERDLQEIDRQTRELAESEARQRELSVRDHLTRLFNRRYLEETLAREVRRSVRSHRPIGIILFDVDQFKQINDRWGHAAGDLILQQVGAAAVKHIRGGDIACRYGGDEFVLVLPEASGLATQQRANLFRAVVKRLQLEYGGHTLGTVTISVGVANYPEHGETVEELLKAADEGLYRAKEAGRDRVGLAEKKG